MKYELASPTWGQEEIDAINAVIRTGRFTMGEKVSAFEEAFAEKFGARYAVMVNSGSSANLLAVSALCYLRDKPLMPGDEVIVPSLSWSTTYFPVHQSQLKLVFVDIDRDSLNIDPSQLEMALSDKTRAVLVPNILGSPADLLKIKAFCDQHGLYLIEDNCESMGATLDGKHAGTYGICGTFSTFFSHHICTMEGGVIITDHEALYHTLLSMRSHGWTRHLPQNNLLCEKSDDPFEESFRFILPGYNLRPIEMMGAMGIEQLKKLDQFVQGRRRNAAYFNSLFENDARFSIQKPHGESSWFGFSFILNGDSSLTRDVVLRRLQAANIDVRPIVSGNFLRNEVLKHLNYRVVGEHHVADDVHDHGFFVGNHHYDISDKLDYLKDVLDSITV